MPIRQRCWRLLVAATMVILAAGPVPAIGAQEPAPAPLDLPALALAPADLPEADFVHDGAFFQPLDEWAASLAAYQAQDAGTVAQRLAESGWQRKYVSIMRAFRPDAPAVVQQTIMTSITEFDDAAGAAAAFSLTEDESQVPTATDLPDAPSIGDQAEITRDEGISGSTGLPFVSLDLAFQVDRFHAGVTLYVYHDAAGASATPVATPVASPQAEPETAIVENLARLLAERLASSMDGPGLGTSALRLAGDDATYTTYDDAYYRRAGTDRPIAGERRAAAAARVATYGAATDVYQLWQGVDAGSIDGRIYGLTLFQFPSEAEAAAWIDDAPETLALNPAYRFVETVADGPAIGDQSVSLTFTPGGADQRITGSMVVARVGAVVARVQVAPSGNEIADLRPVVEALAIAQVECLRAGSCSPVPFPDA